MFEFIVYGKVRGQGRPRTDFNRKRVYKAKEDEQWERSIREAYINAGGPWFGDSPVCIEVEAHRSLPKSAPKRVEAEEDVHKPDASNILKSVEDALNKIAYEDDSQVVRAEVVKAPRTRISEHLVVRIWEQR